MNNVIIIALPNVMESTKIQSPTKAVFGVHDIKPRYKRAALSSTCFNICRNEDLAINEHVV